MGLRQVSDMVERDWSQIRSVVMAWRVEARDPADCVGLNEDLNGVRP